ncbi:MAG: hypothetical protein ACU0CO_10975, partial [Shimia sp.]
MPYVVITGARVTRRRDAPLFWWHAIRSMGQAHRDPACRQAEARSIGGVHHTITAWDDAEAARAYGRSGAHGRAGRVFHRIATGDVWAGHLDAVPGWPEARRLWEDEAKPVRAG